MLQVDVASLQTSSKPTAVFAGKVVSSSNNNQSLDGGGTTNQSAVRMMEARKVCLEPPPSSQVIFTRFYNFSNMSTKFEGRLKKRVKIYEGRKFDPFQATSQQVADFFFYLELTEVVTIEHQKACITSLSKYLPELESEMRVGGGEGDEGYNTFLSQVSPSFSFNEKHKDLLEILPSTIGNLRDLSESSECNNNTFS